MIDVKNLNKTYGEKDVYKRQDQGRICENDSPGAKI